MVIFSSHLCTPDENSLLCKVLSFAIAPERFSKKEIINAFEWSIKTLPKFEANEICFVTKVFLSKNSSFPFESNPKRV